MASYLKFDGIDNGARAAIGYVNGSGTESVVLTAFVRMLSWPTRSAAIMKVSDGGRCYTGIWAYGVGPAVNKVNQFAAVGTVNVGVAVGLPILNASMGANTPFRLGRVYKLQFVSYWDNTGGGYFSAFFVDGVMVGENNLGAGSSLFAPGGTVTLTCGGIVEGAGDKINSISTRYAHFELIQAKYEINRTITLNGGGTSIVAPDGDSDPFVDLTLGSGASSLSGLYTLNTGSGSSMVDESGNGNHIPLGASGVATEPDWAPAADPTFPALGQGVYTFGSIEGHDDLRHSDAPTIYHQNERGPDGPVGDHTAGALRLAQKAHTWYEDGETIEQFTGFTTELTSEADHVFEGVRALHADGATNFANRSPGPSPGSVTTWKLTMKTRFYDEGGTQTNHQMRWGTFNATGTNRALVGVLASLSTTVYSTFVSGASTTNQTTSVSRSVGWHEFAMSLYDDALGTDIVMFWIDGVLVRTETTATLGTDFFAYIGMRHQAAAEADDADGWLDDWFVGFESSATDAQYAGLVEATGSRVLPLFQPAEGVKFFRGVTIDAETAGDDSYNIGTLDVTFRHSIDGGSSWSSPATLNDANLRALACAGNGEDVLEITVDMDSSMDNIGTPALFGITFDYEPAVEIEFLDRDRQLLEVA